MVLLYRLLFVVEFGNIEQYNWRVFAHIVANKAEGRLEFRHNYGQKI